VSPRRQQMAALATIIVMALMAGAVAFYVLAHQRVRFPWQNRYTVQIELASAQALTPGQGQTINVAGVAVGSIDSVKLHDGVALVKASIDPDKLPRIHTDARATVRPKTGLQDMVIALDPGTRGAPVLKDGGLIPVAQTRPQINLDELLASMDADTRDYLRLLVAGGEEGLRGRGEQLRRLFKASAPTLQLTESATAAIADRHAKVERLIHNLRLLSEATAGKDDEFAELISASDAAIRAINTQDAALKDGIAKLPDTINTARETLDTAAPFSRELGPTLDRLTPAVRKLSPALSASLPLLRDGPPQLRDLEALVKTGRPVLADLNPTTADLLATTPDLTRSFKVLRYVANELVYNPPGSEEGYLFWLAWFAHNGASLLTGSDAHGTFWRGQAMFSCSTASALGQVANANEGLKAILAALPCPGQAPSGISGGTK
jgi:phospholipid/cholesterol/gamma-HCH transport system substrate-binding protein